MPGCRTLVVMGAGFVLWSWGVVAWAQDAVAPPGSAPPVEPEASAPPVDAAEPPPPAGSAELPPPAASAELPPPAGSAEPPPAPPVAAAPPPPAPTPAPPPVTAPSDQGTPAAPARIQGFAAELGVGAAAGGHFSDVKGRRVEEAVDTVVSLGGHFAWDTWSLGLVVERLGLGKDHHPVDRAGESLGATYAVDTLWFAGRWYLSSERPSLYLGAALGPALPQLRASGTRGAEGADSFSTPPRSFACDDTGRLGFGLGLSAGVEADLASSWSVLGEARATGHLLSAAADAHGDCGPGSGPALGGSLKLGVAYRFGP